MQTNGNFSVECDVSRVVLSSLRHIYKTERFIRETRRLCAIDSFISAIADSIILFLNASAISKASTAIDCFKVEVDGIDVELYFKFGAQLDADGVHEHDIVFFKLDVPGEIRRNDMRLGEYMRINPRFVCHICGSKLFVNDNDFGKLYKLSNCDGVNFPLLNDQQRAIVETEDKNVLVQGVAGSGKTNICIDKIVFSACRNYSGRILYSTFSRGLLVDTQSKLNVFIMQLERYVEDYKNGRVVFTDAEHKRAIEDKLGVCLDVDGDDKICDKIIGLISFLKEKVDYFLIEDLYRKFYNNSADFANESYFMGTYLKQMNNHQLSVKLEKLRSLSFEVVYKEIYGLILGSCNPDYPQKTLTEAEYVTARRDSFSATECSTIYALALDYAAHLAKKRMLDNNTASRNMLAYPQKLPKYSLAVIDEVQDMTQVNLCLVRVLARKLFCVGDALQMINPSFFSFAYLKRLLYQKDITSVAELAHNYRNTKRIAQIVEALGILNVAQFGTHSFVLKSRSMDEDTPSNAVYVEDNTLIDTLAKHSFDNMTVVVSGGKSKEMLRKKLKSQEILTVSEIKGLERDTVVLYNILSDNADKWQTLGRISVNRKQADENSVFRYYFNLFYVGISRAKSNIYVVESKKTLQFENFFLTQFDCLNAQSACDKLTEMSSGANIDIDELIDRIDEFIKLEQYDNARFAADKLDDDLLRTQYLNRIEVHKDYIYSGDYRGAGVRYWELGMPREAKEQFTLSGDEALIRLIDAASDGDSSELDIGILDYYDDFKDNQTVMRLMLDTVRRDFGQVSARQNDILHKLKNIKENKR